MKCYEVLRSTLATRSHEVGVLEDLEISGALLVGGYWCLESHPEPREHRSPGSAI